MQPPPLPPWAIQACRLWKRSDVPGFALAGTWGGLKVLIFENPHKRSEDDAEFVLCVAQPLRKAIDHTISDNLKKDRDP